MGVCINRFYDMAILRINLGTLVSAEIRKPKDFFDNSLIQKI